MHTIPYIDIRNSSLVELLRQNAHMAKNLIDASRDTAGAWSRAASYIGYPLGDGIARRWLEKSGNPYREEIRQFDSIIATHGLYTLNLCYEWGCTSGVYNKDGNAKLARVLDWPFPALGENLVVAHQSGLGGDFYNVTWPGVSGMFTGMAPGRFAAAIHQAPMRRYLTGVVLDWMRNRVKMYRSNALPPAHLLRKVFETATDYQHAKEMLSREPICLPVIFVLSGVKENEGCVIERTEDTFAIREMQDGRVCVANHFESWLNGVGYGWMPRETIANSFRKGYEHLPAIIDSPTRMKAAHTAELHDIGEDFRWFKPPVANPLSRFAVFADAGQKRLAVIGTAGETPVTTTFRL